MATVSITSLFLNQDKRESEAVVVTIPAILNEGGGRSNAQPEYVISGDAYTAAVIENDTIIQKAYVIVDEAFPTGALLNVDIAGAAHFADVDLTATGMTVSTTEDTYLANPQTVTSVISGTTGDITTGKLRIILDTLHPELKNGRYAAQ